MPETREYAATKRETPREYRATFRRELIEALFDVEITDTNSPVTEGKTLDVDVRVTESGGLDDTQTVTLTVDSAERDGQSVTLAAGDVTDTVLSWATTEGDAGDYEALIESEDDTATTSITVEALTQELTFKESAYDPPAADSVDLRETAYDPPEV
jgi:hypothetical protein